MWWSDGNAGSCAGIEERFMKLTMELSEKQIRGIIRGHFDPTGEHEVKVDLNLRRPSTVVLNTLATKPPEKPAPAKYQVKCLEPATLEEMLASVKGYVMSAEEREAQRQSWARGQAALGECEAERHQHQKVYTIVEDEKGELVRKPLDKLCVYTVVDKKGRLVENSAGPLLITNLKSAENEVESFNRIQGDYGPHELVTLLEVRRERP